ncbi:hypothetical protein A134_23200 [Vibrio crassostreae 9CS106]|uniref:Adenine methyltransferase n=1 Tax=Vibrio crassostreae 9CS106 TaxID=1191300 RepID=A0A1B1C399_9VIBR|nr:hypothetical protein A134_23200 [Vibrio crassostreae 9CS106]
MTVIVKSKTDEKFKDRWATQPDTVQDAQHLFGRPLTFDVCAEPSTAKFKDYFTKEDDALSRGWSDGYWCNPPFTQKKLFIDHAKANAIKGVSGMMLLPYEPLSKWWRERVKPHASIVYRPNGRISFIHPDTGLVMKDVTFGSALVLWTPHSNGGECLELSYEQGVHLAVGKTPL